MKKFQEYSNDALKSIERDESEDEEDEYY